MRYDIYLLQLGFQPVAVVPTLAHKREKDSYIHKEKQYRWQNTQNNTDGRTHKTIQMAEHTKQYRWQNTQNTDGRTQNNTDGRTPKNTDGRTQKNNTDDRTHKTIQVAEHTKQYRWQNTQNNTDGRTHKK